MNAGNLSNFCRPTKAGDYCASWFHSSNVAKHATFASLFVAKQDTAGIDGSRYYLAMLSEWLRKAMDAKGLSQAGLSRTLTSELGRSIDRAAVNKMLKGDRSIKGDELLALERILEAPAPGSQTVQMRAVQVIGHVQAGYWTEAFEWDDDDQYIVPVPPDAAMASFKLYGAEMRGASMDKWRPEGTVVVFADQIEIGEELRAGSRYVVERTNSAGEHECTVKTLWQDEQGEVWLLPESTDPRFQEPLRINGIEGETIRIMGRVTYSVSREG